jgi:hypothetical protein
MKGRTINTGLRITPGQAEKLRKLSDSLGISRNSVVGLLIESAEPKSRAEVSLKVNSHCAPFHGQSATAVEA